MRGFAWLPLVAACAVDPPAAGERPWATYTIDPGEHVARVDKPELHSPIDGPITALGRDYELALDPSASYVLAAPAEPGDQLDWNKLPGLSDCGTGDLAEDGAMFGWRWRIDVEPAVLEIAAYANNAGEHRSQLLFTLDADDLEASPPLRYRVGRRQAEYLFSAIGEVRGRLVAVATVLPRRCVDHPRDPLAWAAGLYFGGTSTAPQTISAQVREIDYVDHVD